MRKILLALSGAAVALTAAPAALQAADRPLPQVCLKWKDGICVSTHRVKGTPPPFASGYVFGPTYAYTPYATLPAPAVSFYHLSPDDRYVYANGYLYVIDPATYAVTRVIDTLAR
jgi:hypothetical protein